MAPYLPESKRQNEVVMSVLVACAFGYAAGGYQVVVDGIVGPWFIDLFGDEAATRKIALHYVVLRPDRETTLARAVGRDEGALTDPGPVLHMFEQFGDVGAFDHHVLDSTGMSPAQTMRAVQRGLTSEQDAVTAPVAGRPLGPPLTRNRRTSAWASQDRPPATRAAEARTGWSDWSEQ